MEKTVSSIYLTRRKALIGAAAVACSSTIPVKAQETHSMHVLKDPSCGCCGSWINIMRAEGFDVSVQDTSNAALFQYKLKNGISEDFASCHTGFIDGYVIEGHVPPADVRRLLSEHPDAVGLSVPGMVFGSPGMGPESERDAYDVILIRKDGTREIFSRYEEG